METANLNAIKALGRSDIFLRLTVIKKVIGFVILAATMWFGPLVMAASNLFFSVVNQIINAWPNRKLLKYSYGQQIADILPSMLLSGVMFGAVWCVQYLHLGNFVTLLIQVIIGVAIYLLGSKLFRIESFDYILAILKDHRKRKP